MTNNQYILLFIGIGLLIRVLFSFLIARKIGANRIIGYKKSLLYSLILGWIVGLGITLLSKKPGIDKRKRRDVLFAIFLFGFFAGCILFSYGLYEYFRTNEKTSDLEADIKISAIDLYNSFTDNEAHADSVYLMQVIQVTGKIAEVKKDTSGIIILLDGGNGMFGVSCSLQETDTEIKKAVKDSDITIKGICTGMLMDVVMTRCVIVPTEEKEKLK